jgi:hypothetical protein
LLPCAYWLRRDQVKTRPVAARLRGIGSIRACKGAGLFNKRLSRGGGLPARRESRKDFMEFRSFAIQGPVEIVPTRLGDERGYFAEIFGRTAFPRPPGGCISCRKTSR